MAVLKSQLAQKNRLLSKVKIHLEKAAVREKELIEKVRILCSQFIRLVSLKIERNLRGELTRKIETVALFFS